MRCSLLCILPLLMLTGNAWSQSGPQPGVFLDTGGHGGWVDRVAFTPDGRQLLSAARDGTVRIWEVESGNPVSVLRSPRSIGPIRGRADARQNIDWVGQVFALAVSP